MLSDLIKAFQGLGLSEQEARERAERNWLEIEDLRRQGSPTAETERELED